jgi:predicted ester cyclase
MPEHDLKATTREGFERMFNRGDLDYVDGSLAPRAVDHQEGPGADFGPHLKQVITTLRTGFPDLHFEIDDILTEGDVVACRSTMTGTHRGRLAVGPLAALEPEGRAVAVRHMHFFRYEDGRVADLWHLWDTMGLMRQLGAPVPEMSVAPA